MATQYALSTKLVSSAISLRPGLGLKPQTSRSAGRTKTCALHVATCDRVKPGYEAGYLSTLLTALRPKLVPAAASCQPESPAPREQKQPVTSDLGWPTNFRDRYLLGVLLGTGAFGTVRRALERKTGQEVAVKVIPKQRERQSRSKTLRRISRELQILSRLQACDNVVQLRGHFEDEDAAYMALECCSGGDLDILIQADRTPITEEQAACVIYQCLKVVDACHSIGIVHGDIKPANFLYADMAARRAFFNGPTPGSLPLIKAIDFGCSQEASKAPLTRRTGTPVYMAPEVFERNWSVEADIWSTGMMMFHLLTQRFPYWNSMAECRKSSLDDVIVAVTTEEIDFSSAAFQKLSPGAVALLRAMLNRDPAQRITAAAALLHPWFAEQGIQHKPSTASLKRSSSNIVPLPTTQDPELVAELEVSEETLYSIFGKLWQL